MGFDKHKIQQDLVNIKGRKEGEVNWLRYAEWIKALEKPEVTIKNDVYVCIH